MGYLEVHVDVLSFPCCSQFGTFSYLKGMLDLHRVGLFSLGMFFYLSVMLGVVAHEKKNIIVGCLIPFEKLRSPNLVNFTWYEHTIGQSNYMVAWFCLRSGMVSKYFL